MTVYFRFELDWHFRLTPTCPISALNGFRVKRKEGKKEKIVRKGKEKKKQGGVRG